VTPLCTLADVEAIGGPVADEDTDRVERLIEMASAAVRRFCHQDFDYAPLPDDLVGLVAAKVAGFLSGQAVNPDGLRSLQTGAMSETYANATGTAQALGPGVLSDVEQQALRAAGYRQGATTVLIGRPAAAVLVEWPGVAVLVEGP
jgi:hypothetical protein